MRSLIFTPEDFDIFHIDGLDERMQAIKEQLWPKFTELGETMSAFLAAETGEDIHYHIARHARRSVNPPDDTWLAFSSQKRGYKKWPHFQIGLWESHLFIWFAVIDEAANKPAIAQAYKNHINDIQTMIPSDFSWSKDHTKPEAITHESADLTGMLDRLENVKKAEILCGQTIAADHDMLQDEQRLKAAIEQTFKTVLPLYELAKDA